MKRRATPTPEPPPIDRAKVRALLGKANVMREAGEGLHHSPVMAALEAVCGNPLAYYAFAFTPDDYHLSAAELDELADGLAQRAAP
jgi:hypothetical protein